MNEFIGLIDMILYDEEIPHHVKQDVIIRVQDWCKVEGHTQYDDYVKRQYYYLLEVKENLN